MQRSEIRGKISTTDRKSANCTTGNYLQKIAFSKGSLFSKFYLIESSNQLPL
jgi:hypothetical protein